MNLNFTEERIELSDDSYSLFKEILEVGIVKASLLGTTCEFVYYEDDEYVFMYDDAKIYNILLKLIAGNRNEVRTILIKYKNTFGVEHALWKQLLSQACSRYSVNINTYSDRYNESAGIPITSDYLDDWDDDNHPYKENNIKEAYEQLISILPQNLDQTKKEYLLTSIERNLEKYKAICGENFEHKEKYITFLIEENRKEISKWNSEKESLLSLRTMVDYASDDSYSEFVKFCDACLEYIESKTKDIIQENLYRTYGPLTEVKQRLRESINRLGFMELLDLYKEYKETEKLLCSKARLSGSDINKEPYKDYVNVYRLGSVLISDRMNEVNRNKAKNRYIPQELKDEAMVFYYDTESVQDAYDELAIEKYSQNKESGNVGEKKVEYALKWLDKSYIRIRRESIDKAGDKCILISNPEFIDEVQEYDHIILSTKGIFCIETKNYSGKLIIDEKGNWIRKRGEEEEGIKNPIQQIRQHEKVLTSFLPVKCEVISIICIANDKAIIEGSDNCIIPIVKSDMLVEYIESFDDRVHLTDVQIQECEDAIYAHMRNKRR